MTFQEQKRKKKNEVISVIWICEDMRLENQPGDVDGLKCGDALLITSNQYQNLGTDRYMYFMKFVLETQFKRTIDGKIMRSHM